MRLSNKQQKDLETIKYFIPEDLKKIPITDEDIEWFFGYSDQGKHKDKIGAYGTARDGFNVLLEGKRWRGIHMHELYEPGILDGSMPYWVILGGYEGDEITPRAVVDFMKAELFKGADAELIERCYQDVLESKGLRPSS